MVKVECEFLWQAQYLVKVQCGAGAAFRDILGDSRSELLYFSIQSRLQDGTSQVSDVLESSLYWRKQFSDVSQRF